MKKKKSKKKSLKSKKLWGLEKLTFPKATQQYMDYDYIDKLGDEEKQFLSKFNNEYYGNTFKKGSGPRNLHVKKDHKKVFDQTNARNRDMYNKRFKFVEGEETLEEIVSHDNFSKFTNPEEALIEGIHKSRDMKSFKNKAKRKGTDDEFTKQLTKVIWDLED